MPQQRSSHIQLVPRAVTHERAARLCRLLTLLGRGPQTRATLTKRLGRDVRSFYRDLELLRAAGIDLPLRAGRYCLDDDAAAAIGRLPFPDPALTLGEAMQLAKGRSQAHKKLKEQIKHIVP